MKVIRSATDLPLPKERMWPFSHALTNPILIMQCMEDHRCPLPQALQFYMGIKKLKNAETQLILYPREPHGIREIPRQSDRLRRIVSWFDRYMKK